MWGWASWVHFSTWASTLSPTHVGLGRTGRGEHPLATAG